MIYEHDAVVAGGEERDTDLGYKHASWMCVVLDGHSVGG